ncbi:hypothetical protein QN277_023507 [Acacia crassicarpa]|uniref:Uncharacterized protein n=1 Tax=Acacia crassicarpa TaxID=499986 RepID=A0AAE1MQS2_9FABA|nr:hypothetical protein QN277_023507 [Acacia crassicarpa]
MALIIRFLSITLPRTTWSQIPISLHATNPRNQRLTYSLNREIPMASTWNISKSLSLHGANPRNQRHMCSLNCNQEGNGEKVTIRFQIETPLLPPSMTLLWLPTGSTSMTQDDMRWNEEGYWFIEVKVQKGTNLDFWLRSHQEQFSLKCRGFVLANWDKTIKGRWTPEDGFQPEADGESDQGRFLAKGKLKAKGKNRKGDEADRESDLRRFLTKRKYDKWIKRKFQARGRKRK